MPAPVHAAVVRPRRRGTSVPDPVDPGDLTVRPDYSAGRRRLRAWGGALRGAGDRAAPVGAKSHRLGVYGERPIRRRGDVAVRRWDPHLQGAADAGRRWS